MSDVFPESPLSSPPATVTPGIEVSHDPEIPVRFVHLWLCDACLDGMGGECHTPGCALWLNRAPDIQLRDSPVVTIMDAAPEPDYEPGSFDIGPGEQVIAELPVAAAPELAAALAETAYVRDIAGTLIGLFRDSRSDGWRARTSGARLKRLAHEAGLPAPDPARRENQALTAYEELDTAHAAALETVDALDADNARLTAECAALTGQLTVMTTARDDLARELDAALTTVSRWQHENQRLIAERDAAQGRERMATMALAEEIAELRADRDQLRRERDAAVGRAAGYVAALELIADPETRREGDPSDEQVARVALEGGHGT